MNDRQAMEDAIRMAYQAEYEGEAPFGCVILGTRGEVLGYGRGSETPRDPTYHSEMEAIREACGQRPPDALLRGCTVVSTHEPCLMCAGALVHAKPARVVWGSSRASLPKHFRARKVGAAEVLLDCSTPPEIVTGYMRHECYALWDDVAPKYKEVA
jgi:tRNA(adenine34) deaminase